jgi:hypothetical protein
VLAFSFRDALRRRLDAVIHRVAHEMNERVVQLSEHGTVGLHAFTGDLQLHLLLRRGRDVAHDARQVGDRVGKGTHPELANASRYLT